MASLCVKCVEVFRPRQHKLQCHECDKWQHRICDTGISQQVYRSHMRGENVLGHWRCYGCNAAQQHVSMDVDLDDTQALPARPDPLEESVIEDPEPIDIPDALDSYTILENGTTRGKPKLFHGGFAYCMKRQTAYSTTWRCAERKKFTCGAEVKEVNGTYIHGIHPHSHLPNAGALAAAQINAEAKQLADASHRTSASAIIYPLLQQHLSTGAPLDALPTIQQLTYNANYYRRKRRPRNPKQLDFDILEQRIPEEFLQDDIWVGSARHIVLATPTQLQLLSKVKTWYLDATFKLIKKPFYQLFTINAFIRSGSSIKQIPLVMVIMSRRKKRDYKKVLQSILRMLPHAPRLKRTVLDFEQALWRALKHILPDAEHKGCAFHYSQAVWRKAQNLGLSTAYNEDAGTNKFIRRILALALLPATHIISLFNQMKTEATTGKLKKLWKYVNKIWIQGIGMPWSIRDWSCYYLPIRTNNDLEGWHRALNTKGRSKCSFYLLVKLLHEESNLVPLQTRLVNDNKLTRRRKKSSEKMDEKLFHHWADFEEGKISAKKLHKLLCYVYAPKKK